MDGFVKLREMLETALRQAGEEAGMLLGQELSATLTDSLSFSKSTYFADLDDGVMVLSIESREEYEGCFYLLFNLRDAILMSSMLLGIPVARIKEKQRLSIIEPDDIDAFGEIGNMVNGALNTVFQSTLPDKSHLKLLGSKQYVPEIDVLSDDEPIPNGDFLLFRAKLEMEGQEMQYLDLMIPVELGSLYDPQPDEPEEAEITAAAAESDEVTETVQAKSAIAGTTGEDMIILFEDVDTDRKDLAESLGFTGMKIAEALVDADVKEVFSQGNARLVMICSEDADDRELAVCIKINALRQDKPVPVMMCARRWTRTAVLKALKYGARDIIIKPCEPAELTEKVNRLLRLPGI